MSQRSGLTQSIRSGVISPFAVLKSIIETRYRDRAHSQKVFDWATLKSGVMDSSGYVALPVDVFFCDAIPWGVKEAVVNALMFWSKMKFNIMKGTSWIDNQTVEVLLAFVRDIELTLRNGVYVHYCGRLDVVSSMSCDEYCEFVLLCNRGGGG